MESAIPAHLAVPRTRPSRVPDDFRPAYPSFVARTPESTAQVVMAYLGAQRPAGAEPGETPAALVQALAGPDGPAHHDRATQVRRDGPTDVVTVAYWDDPAAFDRWFARHREPWLTDRDGGGRWVGAGCATGSRRRRPTRCTTRAGSTSSARATGSGCARAAASA
ncbi:phenylacetaldoxime dehydratase family protein [Pseudonocardia sp. KRD291]|uniref:phenylacetaldoxime dehydratase family protein n=1 Tax=Pseudonocardia sp. KRD291 TaxID=2792007 RepID=UPI001C49CBB1|nr:phenylacetaldoxime dehydratase family protein [Pseudonocardia sp. KRD291]